MIIHVTSYYVRVHRKLTKKDPHISSKIKEKLHLLIDNRNHPSLRLHKLSGGKYEEWSISITGSLRLIFQYVPDGIMLTRLGSHDEVY